MEVTGIGVGDDDRLFRVVYGLQGRTLGAVGHIDDHAHPIHFPHHLLAKPGESAVLRLVTAAGQQALVVVGELHDHQAQPTHHLDQPDFILNG